MVNLDNFIETSLTTPSAYLLVIHGSRNRTTQDAALKLKQMLIAELQSKDILPQPNYLKGSFSRSEPKVVNFFQLPQNRLIDVAALELASLPLSENIISFAHKAYSQGFRRIKIVPLFLVPGVHVTEDIPLEIACAIEQINHQNQVIIELSPYLGKYSGMALLLAQKFSELSAKTRILIAHGSRLPGVADYYKSLTRQLNAVIAYWSTTPSLSQQVKAQIAAGQKKIAILPYFLFPGKITEAIAQQVSELQIEHPEVELILGQPLGTSADLVELIAKEL